MIYLPMGENIDFVPAGAIHNRKPNMAAHCRQGKLAKAAGLAFEKWIDAHHKLAVHLGLIRFYWHNEPRVIPAKGKMIYCARSAADYAGVLKDGRSLAVEAKSISSARFERARITPMQIAHLDAVAETRGLAILVIEFREEKNALWTYRRVAIPWQRVPWHKVRTAESISISDVVKWEIKDSCYLQRLFKMA